MKPIAIIAVLVLVIVGGYFIMDSSDAPEVSPSPTVSAATSPTVSAQPSTPLTVKTFNITGKPFSFSTSEIRVKKGDTVVIIFKNEEGSHDWVIDEFNTRTKILAAGKIETVQFVADKTGTFEYYCSVGTHRQMGMKGKLIVE